MVRVLIVSGARRAGKSELLVDLVRTKNTNRNNQCVWFCLPGNRREDLDAHVVDDIRNWKRSETFEHCNVFFDEIFRFTEEQMIHVRQQLHADDHVYISMTPDPNTSSDRLFDIFRG